MECLKCLLFEIISYLTDRLSEGRELFSPVSPSKQHCIRGLSQLGARKRLFFLPFLLKTNQQLEKQNERFFAQIP